MSTLRWIRAFRVKSSLSAEFQTFMEGHNFEMLWSSDCFTDTLRKVFCKDVAPSFDSMVYIHEPKSMEHWNTYLNDGWRKREKEAFEWKYGYELKSQQLICIHATGELVVMEKKRP